MSQFGITKPEAIAYTNSVINPSLDLGSPAGYFTFAGGQGLDVDVTQSRRGAYGGFGNPFLNEGTYFGTVPVINTKPYTFSLDIKGTKDAIYQIYLGTTAGVVVGTPVQFTGTGVWQRPSVTAVATATGNYRLYLKLIALGEGGVGSYITDGWCCVQSDHDVGYIDGDQEDCYWVGSPHNSASVRRAGSRANGQVMDLADYGFHVDDAPGAGVPELSLHSQNMALLPGSLFIDAKVEAREFSLVGYIVGTSVGDLHAKRKALFDLMKSDAVRDDQAFWITFRPTPTSTQVRIRARYKGGMSFGGVAGFQEGYRERMALRFYANDPFWYEDGDAGKLLSGSQTLLTANYLVQRVGPDWSIVSSSFNGAVRAFAKMPNGDLIVAGEFTDVGSVNGDYILKIDRTTGAITPLGTGMNGYVYALAVAADGTLYATGAFTLAGGVAVSNIAKWDGVTWAPLGSGLNTWGAAIAIGPTGLVYVGGAFTLAGGLAVDHCAVWNGTNWAVMADGGVTGGLGQIHDMKFDPNGILYVVGNFSTAGGSPAFNIAQWDGVNWSPVGGGLNGAAYEIAFSPSGIMYVVGVFSLAAGVPGTKYVAGWNGVAWFALGTGLDGGTLGAYTLAFDVNGNLWIGGEFTSAGGLSLADKLAVWNGFTWTHVPIDLPGSPTIYAIFFIEDDVYIGGSFTGTAQSAYKNTITNPGTASSYPVLRCKLSASGTYAFLKNETTGATLWLNYAAQPEEMIVFDLRPGRWSITSSFKGNITSSALLRNSNLADFYMQPGDNVISFFVINNVNAQGQFYFPVTHWALDGGAL